MRLFLCIAAVALLPLSVQAEEPPQGKKSSILNISCQHCPPLKPKNKVPAYQAPELTDAVQETIIRNVDGHKQIERADQWMGGAPVRFVSRSITFMPPEADLMAAPDTNLDKPDDGVDASATTSAVDGEALKLRN